MTHVLVSGPALLNAIAALPTAVAVGALCAAVVAEIVVVPAVLLPGGTMTLLAGALIGAGRPALAVALPVAAAVVAGDQVAYELVHDRALGNADADPLSNAGSLTSVDASTALWLAYRAPRRYFSGAALSNWWRRRRPGGMGARPVRRGRAAAWLTAAMPSLAGGAGMPYRSFAVRVLVMRVPWLAAALSAGALAARSLAGIGHVAGIAGIAASAVVVAGLLAARHGPGVMRALGRRNGPGKRSLSSTVL